MSRPRGAPRRPLVRLLAATALLVATGACASATPATPPEAARRPAPTVSAPLVGAHYYLWYPANTGEGLLRRHLVPDQGDDPAGRDSADPAVAERAIARASAAGVDFFTLDWWPDGRYPTSRVDSFLRARNLGDIEFCLFYETHALNFDPVHEATPVTPAVRDRFAADLLDIAQRYFDNPSYLHVDGRPVLVLYLTRTLTGDVAGAVAQARRLLAAHGYDPFLIGDEVFWRVTDPAAAGSGSWLTTAPQPARIRLFDAVTAYNLYTGGPAYDASPLADFADYPGRTNVVADELALYQRYRDATNGEVPVIPDVAPGINTRGVRLEKDQPAMPRQWLPGEDGASTFRHLLRDVGLPTVDWRVPMLFVTSWNEWNEDTAIEPVGGVATSLDDSPSGHEFTQGYTYGGEGDGALAALRELTAPGR
ncbi:MAG TPA: hypothetical protein VFJ85_05885 [Acidimicrobiales bacterium]|nr:hypothetical protein [Acidimicrobiales bacterium]